MGLLIKVILHYDSAHWRLASYSGEVVSSAGPVCIRSVRSIAQCSKLITILCAVLMTLNMNTLLL